jgi:hypothetical protein
MVKENIPIATHCILSLSTMPPLSIFGVSAAAGAVSGAAGAAGVAGALGVAVAAASIGAFVILFIVL